MNQFQFIIFKLKVGRGAIVSSKMFVFKSAHVFITQKCVIKLIAGISSLEGYIEIFNFNFALY